MSTKQAGLHARSTKRIVLYVLILAGVIWTWEEVVKDRVIPKRWGVVEKGLIYRSGQLSSSLVQRMLERHDIKVIVDLTGTEPDDKDQRAETKAAAELGIEHLRFPLRGDGTGDIAQYAGAIAAVVDAQRSGKPVLVHCAAGAQRTGGTIAFYRLLVEEKPPSVVVREMARYGWDPKRNKILLDYIDEHMGELAVMLQERGVIEEVPEPLPLLRTAE